MILLLSIFLTDTRFQHTLCFFPTRYSRLDIFKYTLKSYKNLPFTDLYFYIKLDSCFKNEEEHLQKYIFDIFGHISAEKIKIIFDRYTLQEQWIPIITNLKEKHPNKLVWFTQNDDHIFIDFNNDILNEGIELLKNEKEKYKTLIYSHFPEVLKLSGQYEMPKIIGNYLKTNLNYMDSIQLSSIDFLYFIFVETKWNCENIRTDTIFINLYGISTPPKDLFCKQVCYIPLRELVRHFDGYAHVNIYDDCPKLILPSNTFEYDKNTIIKKMIAPHQSGWSQGNNFNIPQEWIDIGIKLHEGVESYTL
jgi:hypothetical protein